MIWSAYGKSTRRGTGIDLDAPIPMYSVLLLLLLFKLSFHDYGLVRVSCFVSLFRTIAVSPVAQRHFEPHILEDNAELASCLSVNYCWSETGFNQGTQFLETCKFCVQTHLWWRCSPLGLIPHGAIYNSPVDS